ncbi:MAG: serine hydrolase [Pseudomonadota bacterium]
MKKVIVALAVIGALFVISIGASRFNKLASIGSGLKTLEVCNETFLAGRKLDHILENDFVQFPDPIKLVKVKIDRLHKEVTGGVGPFGRTKSVYQAGYGCTIVRGPIADVPPLDPVAGVDWPVASPAEHGFNQTELNDALDRIFEDPLPPHRAIVIVKNGKLIAERYAPGFDRNMPMLSYSMAKTVSQMMVGVAIKDKYFALDDRPLIKEWSGLDDPRREITWRHLLQMQSGLDFVENTSDRPDKDVNVLLWNSHSTAQYAIEKPLIHPPGTEWYYSTGTSAILQRGLRIALEKKGVDYYSYARDKIFEPLGVSSAVHNVNSAGEFIGGAYIYATARDWAKLGQLFLQGGVWNGKKILPEGWSEFVSTPASASGKQYGAQMWLNYPYEGTDRKALQSLPETVYSFAGFQGQLVLVCPTLDMIIVHLGRTPRTDELGPINAALDLIMPTLRRSSG